MKKAPNTASKDLSTVFLSMWHITVYPHRFKIHFLYGESHHLKAFLQVLHNRYVIRFNKFQHIFQSEKWVHEIGKKTLELAFISKQKSVFLENNALELL